MYTLLYSLIATIIFGFLDAIIFLFAETSVQIWLINNVPFFDNNVAELLTGGLSAALSIFFASGIRLKVKKMYDIIENPLVDVIGIIIGTVIVIFLYWIYKFIIKSLNRNNNKK
tara:strand:+ start:6444 stop:6785 length:342 start_codon:yes stop_codon:yes gene_type:complete